MTGDSDRSAGLPVVEPPAIPGDAETDIDTDGIAGVLLAAGTSSRFGAENKLLADVAGEPIVRRAARTLADAGLMPRVAVVGHEADRVASAVADLGFETVHNPDYEDGQATSVGAGVSALDGTGVDAAVFALGDAPFVAPSTVRKLVAAYRVGRGTALAAACDGARGNPVLFDARYFDQLAGVTGDVGGRAVLLGSDDAALVETGDPGVRFDVDTPEDLTDAPGDIADRGDAHADGAE